MSHDELLGTRTQDRWLLAFQVALVLVFGMSAHAAKNALAPAEPMLHKIGVSPVTYAFVAAAPQLGCIFLPTIWGSVYRGYERLVLSIVPAGMLIGQVLILFSFILLEGKDADSPGMSGIGLCVGLVIFTIFHGGAHVVQCTVMTRVLPCGLTSGFVGTIAATHLIVAACNFTIPWAWNHGGIISVQTLLLIPAVLSLIAGLVLAWMSSNFAVPHHDKSRLPSGLSDGLLNQVLEKDQQEIETPRVLQRTASTLNKFCLFSDMKFVYWLSLWKALEVGSLHSFRTIKNALLVSLGETATDAGILLGTYQAIGLLILPLAGVLFDVAERRVVVQGLSWSLALAFLMLSVSESLPAVVWKASMLVVSIAEVLLPVLPLALVPQYCEPSVGTSYGLLESSFSLAQVLLTVATGFLRNADGFHYAMVLFTTTFTVGSFTACHLAKRIK